MDQESTPPELTAIILTFNEAEHIESCIKSLSWTDRVVVYDSYSQDDTVALAAKLGAEVKKGVFQNFAQQRNDALESILTDWVFFVDADERGTAELGIEIRQVIHERPEVAWHVPRDNYIFGRLTRGAGWYPDYQLRLFRHGWVRYERPVHEIAIIDGEEGFLQSSLIHYNYRDPAQFHEKQVGYNDYDAKILKRQGVKPNFFTPFSQALRQFWWRFAVLKGYQDGVHGLKLSAYMAYYEWLKYRKLRGLWRTSEDES